MTAAAAAAAGVGRPPMADTRDGGQSRRRRARISPLAAGASPLLLSLAWGLLLAAAPETRNNEQQMVSVVTVEQTGAGAVTLSELGPLNGAVDDACGVCGGTGTRCQGCDGVVNSGHRRDICGVCRGDGSSCLQRCEVQVQVVTVDWAADIIWSIDDGSAQSFGPNYFADNSDTTQVFTLTEGAHTLVFSDNFFDGWDGAWVRVFEPGRSATLTEQISSTDAVPSGSVDFTVLCLGPIGCDGVANSGLTYDSCNVCGGDGSTCDLRGWACTEGAYGVTLSVRPYSPVEVTVADQSCATPTQCDIVAYRTDDPTFALGSTLHFDATNWNTPQVIVVYAIDDEWDQHAEPYIAKLLHSVQTYDVLDNQGAVHEVNVNIVDNDHAGVKVWRGGRTLQVTEGGVVDRYGVSTADGRADVYGFSLYTAPEASVTLTVHWSGEIVVEPANVTFTPMEAGDWPAAHYFTVAALDDFKVDSASAGNAAVWHTWTSTDTNYVSVGDADHYGHGAHDLNIVIADNDVAAVYVAPDQLDVHEGGGCVNYTIWLGSQPITTVVLSVVANDTDAVIEPTTLEFDNTDWNVPKMVTFNYTDDLLDEAEEMLFAISCDIQSADADYAAVTAQQVFVKVHDNDAAGIALSVSATQISEAGTWAASYTGSSHARGNYTVRLTSEPREDVTVEVSVPADDVLVIVPANAPHRLTFTPLNWMVPQDVSIVALDDLIDEDSSEFHDVLHRVVQSGAEDVSYAPVTAVLTVEVVDDDTAPLPDAYELCDVVFGPRSGGTLICLAPVFRDEVFAAMAPAGNLTNATNATDVASNATNATTMVLAQLVVDETSWAVMRPLYYRDMVIARPESLSCRLTHNNTFGASGRTRFVVPGSITSSAAGQMRFTCASPPVASAGLYQVEMYVGSGYGEAGWKLAVEYFVYHDVSISTVVPHSGPRAGDTLMAAGVTTSIADIAPESLRPGCRLEVDYSTTIGGIALQTVEKLSWPATNYTPHDGDSSMYCHSPPSTNLGDPCIDLCTPVCDVPPVGEQFCEYCGPECHLTVHIRTEAYAEEIYFSLDGGAEIGGLSDYRDVYLDYQLEGSDHNVTFVDTNGGGWNGGTIEILDTDTGEVVMPAYTVTGTSGVLVNAQWGERKGTIPFTCGRPYERPACPKVREVCRCPESCETICGTYGVKVTLNGQQYTDSMATFDYYESYSLVTMSTYTGPVKGDTVIAIVGTVEYHSALGVAGVVPGFVPSDNIICTFHLGDESMHVPAVFDASKSDAMVCESPPWVSPVRVFLDVALNGQQYTATQKAFQYYAPAVISAVVPNQYPVYAVNEIVELGISGGVPFRGTPWVKFGDEPAFEAPYAVSTSGVTTLASVGPPCSIAGKIPIFLSYNGQQFESGGDDFYCQPKLAAVNPPVSPSRGGTAVNITGSGFNQVMTCRFQGKVVTPAITNGTSLLCVSPTGSTDTLGSPSSVGISADGRYFVEHIFHYIDFPEPLSFSPHYAPVLGAVGFQNTQHQVSVVVDANLDDVTDIFLQVGMFQPGADQPEVVANALFQPGMPAYVIFSSAEVAVPTPGDRRLAFSLNGQQFSEHNTPFNYWDPCEHAEATRASPISGPTRGATVSVVGSNIAKVAGLQCAWTEEDGTFVSAPGRFLSGTAAECDLPSWNGTQVPRIMPVRVKNSAGAAAFCNEPWGVGSQWSTSVEFAYTRVAPRYCEAAAVAEWKSVAGGFGRMIIQSAWGPGRLAETGGDSFSLSMNAKKGRATATVIDLDIDHVNFADFPSDAMDFDTVDKAAALLAFDVASADSLCARTQQLGSCCRALRSECNQKDNSLGKYMGAWQTTVSGDYTLSVTVAGEHIKGSPFAVAVIPGDFSYETSACLVFFQDSYVGDMQQATVNLRDLYHNSRGANFLVDSGENVTVEITITSALRAADVYWNLEPLETGSDPIAGVEPYTYADNSVNTMYFTVPAARYRLVALSASSYEPTGWHGTKISMVVAGDTVMDEALTDFSGSVTLTVIIGLEVLVDFYQCSPFAYNKTGPCDYNIALASPIATATLGSLASVSDDGTMTFGVQSSQSGKYIAIAKINEQPMDCNGSFVTFFPGPTDAVQSTLRMGPQEHGMFVAGEAALVYAESRDEYGNLREKDDDSIVAMLQYDCGGVVGCTGEFISLNITNGDDDGMYEIRFMTTRSGDHLLTVWLNDEMIRAGAQQVQVGPSAMDFVTTSVAGIGWSTAEAGAYSNFLISMRDRFGNSLTDARVFETWTCFGACKSTTADACDQFCTAAQGGLFNIRVKLLGRLQPDRERPVTEETICAYSVRYVDGGQFEAVYTCTVSGVYSILVWDTMQGSPLTGISSTTSVKATVASASLSVIHDLDRFDTDAGDQAEFKIQLVDAYGNQRFEGFDGADLRVEFQIENPLPVFWTERPDLDARFTDIFDDGTGVVLVQYRLYPAITYTAHVTIMSEQVVGNSTGTWNPLTKSRAVTTHATCTGTADEIVQSCSGRATFIPEACYGSATDGFTNCTDNYIRYPSGNCALGLGVGCTYRAPNTPNCYDAFANVSAVTQDDCPRGCTYVATYTPVCTDAFTAASGIYETDCPVGCAHRVARSPFVVTMLAGPAPRLMSATLDSSMFRIIAEFDMPTNMGRLPDEDSPGSCTGLFPPALATSFGSGYICTWETPSKLVITLGSETTVLDRLDAEPSCTGVATTTESVAAVCVSPVVDCDSFSSTACGAVGLMQCGASCIPEAALNCPALFTGAGDTTSSSCPSGCTYSAPDAAATPTCDLDASTDGTAECPLGCFRPSVIGIFRILSSGNILSEYENSAVCQSSKNIDLPTQSRAPVAVIVGPKVVGVCDPVSLSSASHGGGALALQHVWTVWAGSCVNVSCAFDDTLSSDTAGLFSVLNSSDDSILFDKGALLGGHRYVVRLQVTNLVGMTATAEWDFIVIDGSVPTLSAPHTLQVADVALPIAVEVSPVMDVSCIPNGAVIRYFWSQVESGAPLVELGQPAAKDLAVPANALNASVNYHFQLFAWYSTAPQATEGMPVAKVWLQSVGSQTKELVSTSRSADPNTRSVADPNIVIVASQPVGYVNPAGALALYGSIASQSDGVKWYAVQGTVNLSATATTTTGRAQHNLVLAPTSLLPGQIYRFRLYTTSETSAISHYGEITVRVNQPPVRGSFLVEPTMGYALSTQFALVTQKTGVADWVDDAEDMPIQVRYSYFRNGEEFALSRLAPVPNRAMQLPPGDVSPAGFVMALSVAAYPTDQYLAETKVTVDVIVQSPVNAIGNAGGFGSGQALEQVVETYMTSIEAAAALGDSLQVVYMLTLAAQQLNAGDGQRRRLASGIAEQRQSLRIRMFELGESVSGTLPTDQHGRRSSLAMIYNIMLNPCEISYDIARRGMAWAEKEMGYLHEFSQQDLSRIARIASLAARAAASEGECSDSGISAAEMPDCAARNATYMCAEGRCFVETFDQNELRCIPDGITTCLNGTCSRTLCSPGLCPPGATGCAEGRCIIQHDGTWTCLEGRCRMGEQTYGGEFCNFTAEEAQAATEKSAQMASCMSLNTNAILLSAVRRFAVRQIVGEATVRVETDTFVLHASMQPLQATGTSELGVTSDTEAWNTWRVVTDHGCSGTPIGVAAVEWGEQLVSPSSDASDGNETKPLSFTLDETDNCDIANAALGIVPPWSALPVCLMPCYDDLPVAMPAQLTCAYLESLTTDQVGTGGRCDIDLGTIAWLMGYVSTGTILSAVCPRSCGLCPAQAHQVTKEEADACAARAAVEGRLAITCYTFSFAKTEWSSDMCTAAYDTPTRQFVCQCKSLPDGPLTIRSVWEPPPPPDATIVAPVHRPVEAPLSFREMKRGFVIPLSTFIALWLGFAAAYSAALLTDKRARHQVYMMNEMKGTYNVPVLPKRTGEIVACFSECSDFVKRHHLLWSTKTDGLGAHRVVMFACFTFTTGAASALVLVLPRFLRSFGWGFMDSFGDTVDDFIGGATGDEMGSGSGTTVGETVEMSAVLSPLEAVVRRAILAIIIVSPLELLARVVLGRLRHTEQQAARAKEGLGGREWSAPPPAQEVALVTKVQASFRRHLVQLRLVKQLQLQTMAAMEAVDKQRVKLEWATSGIGEWKAKPTETVRYRATVKLILHASGHAAAPNTGTVQALTEFDVLEMQAGKARHGEHMTRWFLIRETTEDGTLRHGWVRETSYDGKPLCVPVEGGPTSSAPGQGIPGAVEPTAASKDDGLPPAAEDHLHLARLKGISSFYKGLQENHHTEGVHRRVGQLGKHATLLPPIHTTGAAAVAKWKQRHEQGLMHPPLNLDFVREMFNADASQRLVEVLLDGHVSTGVLLSPEKLMVLVVRMQARVRGVLERRRLRQERALAATYPYDDETTGGRRGEARRGGRSSVLSICASTVGACAWCVVCSFFALTVAADTWDTKEGLEWLACCGVVSAAQAFVLWPVVLILGSATAQCARICSIDKQVRSLFRAMDRDHTASVDHAEFSAMIDLLGKEAGARWPTHSGSLMSEDEVGVAFRLMDIDLDGSVTLKEFAHWWRMTHEERADFQSEPASWAGLSMDELRKARRKRLQDVRTKHKAARQRAKNVETRRMKLVKTGMSMERANELAEKEEAPVTATVE